MGTLDYGKHIGIAFDNARDAFDKIKSGEGTIMLYSSSNKKLEDEISNFYSMMRQHNKAIEEVDNQLLPSCAYYWDDIDGCLAVKCAEISARAFKENASGISFTGWEYSVLTKPSARKPLSTKALTTIALMGSMIHQK